MSAFLELLAQGADALGRLLLPGARLILDLAAGLADEVARLCFRLLCDVAGLLGRRTGHLPSGVGRGTADVSGLVPGHLGGRLPGRRTGRRVRRVTADLLGHRCATPVVSSSSVTGGATPGGGSQP